MKGNHKTSQVLRAAFKHVAEYSFERLAFPSKQLTPFKLNQFKDR